MGGARDAARDARILIVEDDEDVAASLQALLEPLPGVSCETASTFEGGRERVRTGRWALIICDERLPDGLGTDLLRESARRSPSTRRMLITAHAQEDIDLRAFRDARVDFFIRKPWDDAAMLAKVEQLLEEDRPGAASA